MFSTQVKPKEKRKEQILLQKVLEIICCRSQQWREDLKTKPIHETRAPFPALYAGCMYCFVL